MNLNKTFIYIFLIFTFMPVLNAATPTNAERVYKWVDEDGQTNYGSRPQDVNAKEIKIKNRYIDSGSAVRATSAQERVDKQKRFNNAMDAEKKSISDEKRKKKEQEELKIQRCHASRDQLRRREAASALYDLDEKGNRILLNKKQYEIAMEQARARVEKWCN